MREQSRSVLKHVSEATVASLQEQLDRMAARALGQLIEEGVAEEAILMRGLFDARYDGQSYELTIPLEPELATAFHAAHAEMNVHAMPDQAVEVVNLRMQATGLVEGPELTPEPLVEGASQEALLGEKEAPGVARLPLYERAKLRPGAAIRGPSLVFQMDSTAFIAPSWRARADVHGWSPAARLARRSTPRR